VLGWSLAWLIGPSLGVSSLNLEAAVGTLTAAFLLRSSFHYCHARRRWLAKTRIETAASARRHFANFFGKPPACSSGLPPAP
jgi:hypothetical protein